MEKDSSEANKWEGKVSKRLDKATVDQIWPLFVDFFNFHKWFPIVKTCDGIHGKNGEPGCIRYCTSRRITSSEVDGIDVDGDESISWANERLIVVDHAENTLTYEVLENNVGFKSYVSTVKIVRPCSLDDHDRPRGCVIEWSFTVDPIDGWTLDGMVATYQEWIQLIAHKMEGEVLANNLEQAN